MKEDQGSQSVCYVDDETEQVRDSCPHRLQEKIQHRINIMTGWLADNKMIVSPAKTKLIVSANKELRAKALNNISITVNVSGNIIKQTPSEKLLGVVISEDLTWAPYLWGETWREEDKNWPGLVPTLTRRLSLLKYLARLSSKEKMRQFIPGLFTSKLRYALPLVGTIWGIQYYTSREPTKYAMTKADLMTLQTLQRQAAILINPPTHTPDHRSTSSILDEVGWPSVNQLIALTTLTILLRTLQTGRPRDLAREVIFLNNTRTRQTSLKIPRVRLNISLESYHNQATRLYNELPEELKRLDGTKRQKNLLIKWVKTNVQYKP